MTRNELIKKFNAYTEENYHGKALEILSLYVDMHKECKILKHINAICEIEGELPNHIHQYREEIRKKVFNHARIVMGDEFNKLN